MAKEFIGFCGYKTTNKGAYNQHVQTCEKCRSYYSGSSTTSRVVRKLTRWGEAARGSIDEEALGRGNPAGKTISRCCYAPMEFDKKKRLMVCSQCGKSSWEVK